MWVNGVQPDSKLNELAHRSISGVAESLVGRLHRLPAVAVAWSGGVDSAVVAKAAVLAQGERAVAVTAVSPSLAASERETARSVARSIGIRHVEIETSEFEREEYRRNAGDRCFFCKETLYSLMADRRDQLRVQVLANGTNLDDLGDYRPGMRAAERYGVRSPLIEEGLSKITVRELARYWGLSVAEKPASPCLSSRIAYGVEVTEERVRRVELAEAWLREVTGVEEFRVRYEAGDLARIEVPLAELPRYVDETMREAVVKRLLVLGFRNVTLDLQGFRSGSHNAALVELTSASESTPGPGPASGR